MKLTIERVHWVLGKVNPELATLRLNKPVRIQRLKTKQNKTSREIGHLITRAKVLDIQSKTTIEQYFKTNRQKPAQ